MTNYFDDSIYEDCIKTLEVKPDASLDDIKRSYKDLAKVWHPDKFHNDKSLTYKAAERFKQINAAYDYLKEHHESYSYIPPPRQEGSEHSTYRETTDDSQYTQNKDDSNSPEAPENDSSDKTANSGDAVSSAGDAVLVTIIAFCIVVGILISILPSELEKASVRREPTNKSSNNTSAKTQRNLLRTKPAAPKQNTALRTPQAAQKQMPLGKMKGGSKHRERKSHLKPLTQNDINTSLFVAVLDDNQRLVSELINKGANVNVVNDNGYTPIMLALKMRSIPMAEALFSNGAILDFIKGKRYSPLSEVVRGEYLDGFYFLLDNGVDIKHDPAPLTISTQQNNYHLTQRLLDAGANPNLRHKKNKPPLFIAIQNNNPSIAELLIQNGASTNYKIKYGKTKGYGSLLTWISSKGNLEMVKLLLKSNIDIDQQDTHGETALMKAAWKGHAEVVRVLMEHGADDKIKNVQGWTALLIAQSTHKETVEDALKGRKYEQRRNNVLLRPPFSLNVEE